MLKKIIFCVTLFTIISASCLATDFSSDPDFENSNHYKSWTRVLVRDFEVFKTEHVENKKVMIFGTGHNQEKVYTSIPPHPKNVYMVDIDIKARPDLLMNTDIEEIPNIYIGQFDIVIFEGFQNEIEKNYITYNRKKSFSNVYELLKKDGIFLLPPENDRSDQLAALQASGFKYLNNIQAPNEEAQYVGCMSLFLEDEFLRMQKCL